LPLISSRLLRHRMTRSLNSMSVCKAELFCSRCQTRIFLIHSLKRRFQLLCTRRNQHSPRLRQHPRGIPEEPGSQSSHLAVQILLQNHGYGTHSTPKIWRKAKVIAVEKPGKDPSLAANYLPISLLSVCYKLLERRALQHISPTVEGLLSPDQAGFRKG